METIPLFSPMGILVALVNVVGLLTLITLIVGIVRLIWRRDWRWLAASGGLVLLTILLVATFTVAARLRAR